MYYNKEKITKGIFNIRDGRLSFLPGTIFYVKPEWVTQMEKNSVNTKARPMMVIGSDVNYRMSNPGQCDIKMCEISSNYCTSDCIPIIISGLVTYIIPSCTANIQAVNLINPRPYAYVAEPIVEMAKYLYYKPVSGEEDPEMESILSKYQSMILDMIENGVVENYRRATENELSTMREKYCGGKFKKDYVVEYVKCPEFNNSIVPCVGTKTPELLNTVEAIDKAKVYKRNIGNLPIDEGVPVYKESPDDGFNSFKDALSGLVKTVDNMGLPKVVENEPINKEQLVDISGLMKNNSRTVFKEMNKKPIKKQKQLRPYQRYGIGEDAGKIKLISKKNLTDDIRYAYLYDCVQMKGVWREIAEVNGCAISTAMLWATESLKALEESKKKLPEGVYTIFQSKRGRHLKKTSSQMNQVLSPA